MFKKTIFPENTQQSYDVHTEVHSPFTEAAHWIRINAMDWVNLFSSLKSELLPGKQQSSFIFFWHSLSRESTRLLQVAMCSVVANVMAFPPQRGEGKSKTGQNWAPPMCCARVATTTRPAETGDAEKPVVWSSVLFSTPVSLKCMSNTMLKSNMD